MRTAYFAMLAATVTSFPAHAAGWPDATQDSRVGAFVGVRLQLRAGGPRDAANARTSFAIAPTHSRYLNSGEIHTRIGEGFALEFSSRDTTRVTLAGVPVQQVLGLVSAENEVDVDRKLGISTGGWAAIGLGAAALAGAVIFVSQVNDCDDHDDECP